MSIMENTPFPATFTYTTVGKPRVRGAIQSAIAEARESHMDVLEVMSTDKRPIAGQVGYEWVVELMVKCKDEKNGEPWW